MRYRRAWMPGGSFFFTVVTFRRQRLFTGPQPISQLRAAFHQVMTRHPFRIDGIVVLPDHIHCIWTLPAGDGDFSTRWRLIKSSFSRERVSPGHRPSGGRTVWQRRFWEHTLRDERDFRRHLDYIHFNPVKHGLVRRTGDWPYSSFHRWVRDGGYPADWGGDGPDERDELIVLSVIHGAPGRETNQNRPAISTPTAGNAIGASRPCSTRRTSS